MAACARGEDLARNKLGGRVSEKPKTEAGRQEPTDEEQISAFLLAWIPDLDPVWLHTTTIGAQALKHGAALLREREAMALEDCEQTAKDIDADLEEALTWLRVRSDGGAQRVEERLNNCDISIRAARARVRALRARAKAKREGK